MAQLQHACRRAFRPHRRPRAYPLITLLLYAVFPPTDGCSLWQRTLLIVPANGSAIIRGLITAVHRHFHGFINRPA